MVLMVFLLIVKTKYYISDSDIKTSGSVSDKENNPDVNGGITASAVVSEFGGTIFMNGDNSVETGGHIQRDF